MNKDPFESGLTLLDDEDAVYFDIDEEDETVDDEPEDTTPIQEEEQDEEEDTSSHTRKPTKTKSTSKQVQKPAAKQVAKQEEPDDMLDTEEDEEDDEPVSTGQIELNYNTIASQMLKDGVFQDIEVPEDEELDAQGFANLIDKEIESGIASFIQDMNNRSSGLIEFLQAGGDVKDWVTTTKKASYKDFKVDSLKNNEKLAEQVLEDAYKRKGFKPERIKKMIERAKDLDTLIEDAQEELPDLVEADKSAESELLKEQKRQEEIRKKEVEKTIQLISDQVDKTEAFIPTVKANKKTREAIKNLIFERKVMEKIRSNPVDYEIKLAVLDYYGMLDLDFSKIANDLKSKAAPGIKEDLIKGMVKTSGSRKPATTKKANQKADDIMSSFIRDKS